jgi:hypothetical protein
MDPLNIFLLVLAGCFLLWEIGIGIAAIAIIAKGGRITAFGIGPGVLFIIFLALGLFV